MGSLIRAHISGFVCRLCSLMNRSVVLIFSKEGERMGLIEKINLLLPISVQQNDELPKTVCVECIQKLNRHFKFYKVIQSNQNDANKLRRPLPSSCAPM